MADTERPASGKCDILVGARGWDHASWGGGFYPDDLPEEWRLTYYSNCFGGVLVPEGSVMAADGENLAGWLEDVTEDFRFFVEFSGQTVALCHGDAGTFLDRLSPLGTQVGGLLLDVADDSLANLGLLTRWMERLTEQFPVTLRCRMPEVPEELLRAAKQNGIGLSWRPGVTVTTDCGTVCIGEMIPLPEELRELRHRIEEFLAYAAGHDHGLLVFSEEPKGFSAMGQARVIVDLLGG